MDYSGKGDNKCMLAFFLRENCGGGGKQESSDFKPCLEKNSIFKLSGSSLKAELLTLELKVLCLGNIWKCN